jgi:YebC/PmpR family DNA-binding regulatory protein
VSGHSKWSTIKHKKAMLDSRRGKAWSKLARAITMAAQQGGGNANDNPRLRLAIDKARGANMPKDTIEKAIKKGTGELEGESYEEILYEGYGPNGVAIMCKAVTDNRNRTAPEIKKLFERFGGNVGATNSVAYMFSNKGVIVINRDAAEEDRILEITLEAGAEDVLTSEMIYEIRCTPETFDDVKAALEEAKIELVSADLSLVAANEITLDLESATKVMKLIDGLEDHEDVEAVYSNSDIPDDVMSKMAEE